MGVGGWADFCLLEGRVCSVGEEAEMERFLLEIGTDRERVLWADKLELRFWFGLMGYEAARLELAILFSSNIIVSMSNVFDVERIRC